jgi:gamma-glutamylcyclotransferase (GGCT)/AIG2-like uncharacterized protein YtfP
LAIAVCRFIGPTVKTIDLFVYGTLMSEATVHAITGRHFERVGAVLPDFQRIVAGADYPYVVPAPGASVHGLLLLNIDEQSLAAIDRYEDEGRLYRRTEVTALVGDQRRRCAVYVGIASSLRSSQ